MKAVGSGRRAAFFPLRHPHPPSVRREETEERKYWLREEVDHRWGWAVTADRHAWTESRRGGRRSESERDNRRCDCTNWWYPFYRGSNRNTEPSSLPRLHNARPILSFLLFDFFLFFLLCFCIRGLVTKPRALFGFPRSEVRGRTSFHPPLRISPPPILFFLGVCALIRIKNSLRVCVFFLCFFFLPSQFPHFAPICFMLAVRSHLCQCFIPSVRVSAWVWVCVCVCVCVCSCWRIHLCSHWLSLKGGSWKGVTFW